MIAGVCALTLALVALGGPWPGGVLRAQAPPAGTEKAAPTAAAATSGVTGSLPLARYVPREKLILYVEFAGLDAHAAAWKNTAAYKMLNETPLGVMLEEVAAQLFDKGMGYLPTRKVSGAELVTFLKAAARNGWVLSVGAGAKGEQPAGGDAGPAGAAAKDLKSITSRLLGMMMAAEPRPKIERKAGRVLIAVPRGSAADAGWTWWPEKNDLVVGFVQPSDADAILASLDGKGETPSGLPLLSELSKADGSFEPVLTAYIDPSTCPAEPKTALADFCRQLKDAGVNRLDYRWGFDKEALMGVTRLVAPRPRKPLLAAFDQPAIDGKSLIPLPEGVDSFILLSASPAKMIEALGQVGSGDLKGKIDDLVEKVKVAEPGRRGQGPAGEHRAEDGPVPGARPVGRDDRRAAPGRRGASIRWRSSRPSSRHSPSRPWSRSCAMRRGSARHSTR